MDEQEMKPLRSAADACTDAIRRLFWACPPKDRALRARIAKIAEVDRSPAVTPSAEGEKS
jgi:hypothetical protein